MDEVVVHHADLVAALRRAVFESAGETDPALRQAVGAGDPVDPVWAAYAEKVRTSSHRITDADVAALVAAGRTEVEIFEVTVAAATGAALQRLDAGLRAAGGDVRLGVVEHGHGLPARLFLRIARLVGGGERMDDVVTTGLHRPGLWGRPFFALVEAVMRGPSFWTPAEREYLAAHVSRLNECPFCRRAHTETTRLESRGGFDLDDASSVRPELAAVLPLMERLTAAPDALSAADVVAIRQAGVPDDAVVDALHVALVFHTANRMANALGWSWDSDEHVRAAARAIHRTRYRLPGIVLR